MHDTRDDPLNLIVTQPLDSEPWITSRGGWPTTYFSFIPKRFIFVSLLHRIFLHCFEFRESLGKWYSLPSSIHSFQCPFLISRTLLGTLERRPILLKSVTKSLFEHISEWDLFRGLGYICMLRFVPCSSEKTYILWGSHILIPNWLIFSFYKLCQFWKVLIHHKRSYSVKKCASLFRTYWTVALIRMSERQFLDPLLAIIFFLFLSTKAQKNSRKGIVDSRNIIFVLIKEILANERNPFFFT